MTQTRMLLVGLLAAAGLVLAPSAPAGEVICDCNANGVEDAKDIAGGKSVDRNENGVPDECDECVTCFPDLNCDGRIDVLELLMILQNWGACAGSCPDDCPEDLNLDGSVGIDDLLIFLAHHGVCF